MLELDTRDPGQVVSHQVLRADLGQGGRSLTVLSGIARPEWRIDSDKIHTGVWRVLLHEPAETIEQSAVHVGLASFSNDDTEFVFATDQATVTTLDGELVLDVNLALLGEPSTLNRFSYQVVLVSRVVPSEITGTLTWPTPWFRPVPEDASAVARVFTVTANEQTFTSPPPPGTGGTTADTGLFPPTPIEHLTPLATAVITAVTVTEEVCHAAYRIGDPPKGRQLKVVAEQHGLQPVGGGVADVVPVDPASVLVKLSAAQPTRAGVDFVARRRPSGPA